jgi:hypothetical protein
VSDQDEHDTAVRAITLREAFEANKETKMVGDASELVPYRAADEAYR